MFMPYVFVFYIHNGFAVCMIFLSSQKKKKKM